MSMSKTLCKMRVTNVKLKLLNVYSTVSLVSCDLHFRREEEAKERLAQIHQELDKAFEMLEILTQKIEDLEVE